MGTLFKLLRNELLSLGMLFFVIVPFVGDMIHDQNAPAGVRDVAYKAESLFSGSLDGFGGMHQAKFGSFSMGGSSSGVHVNGGPIYIPQS